MNILFLVPPVALNNKKASVDRVYGCNYGFDYKPAIHLLLLATMAQNSACQVRLLDCPAEGYNNNRFRRYLLKNKDKIDLVVFFTVWLSRVEDLLAADIISKISKRVKIIFAGPYPTWKPQDFLRDNSYIVIRGEPEATFVDLIDGIRQGSPLSTINGISFLHNDKHVENQPKPLIDLNTLPILDRRLLKGEYFFNRLNSYPATVMCTSRGCSYSCTYCAPQALDQAVELEHLRFNSGKPMLRLRSAEIIVEEFQEISALGYRGVEICDNQFLWDEDRITKICNGIEHLKLSWICNARADHIKNEDLLRLMRKAGCQLIYIGTESFNQDVLNDLNKGLDVSENYRAVNLLRKCGIEPEISVLLGASELETEKMILETISEARRLKTRFVHYSIVSPLPNTQLYKVARNKGWFRGGEFTPVDNTREAMLNVSGLGPIMLKKIIRGCYRQQYLSFGFIIKQIFDSCSLYRLKHKVRAFLKFSEYIFQKS